MEDVVQWNVKVSADTDRILRHFLEIKGDPDRDLSEFVEEAVRSQVFHSTIQEIKARNAHAAGELQAIIDDAVEQVRTTGTARRS